MEDVQNHKIFTKNIIETVIKIAVLGIMVIWAFQLIKPFLTPVIWGMILAVALEPLIAKMAQKLGGRRSLAAGLFVFVVLEANVFQAIERLDNWLRIRHTGL